MTATAAGRRSAAPRERDAKRGKRALFLGLAGVVVTAGVAGAVVTSSAYFTDQKTVAANTVTTNSIKIAMTEGQATTTSLAHFDLANLAPAATADLTANRPEMKVFTVQNTGTGNFTWTGDVVFTDANLTKTDGTALPSSTGSNSPSAADAKANIYVQFGTPTLDGNGAVTSVNWETAHTLADTQSASTKEIASTTLNSSATSTKVVRFYMSDAIPTSSQNDYQNVKLSYTLQVDATQIHS